MRIVKFDGYHYLCVKFQNQLMKNIFSIVISLTLFSTTNSFAVVSTLPTGGQGGFASVADTSRVFDLDEVTVVRQPKEQFLLRRQAVSSTMFSAADLSSYHATDLREASAFVPNFVMSKYGSRYTSAMYVRGIGSRVNSPAVGIYVDGMPLMSKSAFNTFFHDISRIDVLRGPQGTLYGLNTEGGLIRIYSRNPIEDPGTEWKATVGSHSLATTSFTTRQRLSSVTGLSLSGFYAFDKGFRHNDITATDAEKSNEAGGRLKFVYVPTARTYLNIIADYQYTNQNAFPYGILDDNDYAAEPTSGSQGRYRRNIFNASAEFGSPIAGLDFTSTTSYQHLYDFMSMDIDYQPADFLLMNEKQRQNTITQEFSLKGTHNRRWRSVSGLFGSMQWLHTDAPVFFNDGMDKFLSANIQRPMYNAMLNAFAARFMQQGMPEAAAQQAAKTAIDKAGGVSVDADMQTVPGLFDTPTFNFGIYHESTLTLTDRLTATLGLRYDWSRVGIDYSTSAAMNCNVNVMGQEAKTRISSVLCHEENANFGQLLPKFSLSYAVDNNNSNIYATVAKGYRAGGFNIQMFSDIMQAEISSASNQRGDYEVPHNDKSYDDIRNTISYKPETSWNYEIGTHLNLFGNSLHVDAAAFFMQVSNQQLSVMAGTYGFGRMMVNAGKSNSYGVELALRGSAFDNHLSYTASYGLTHATFRKYTDNVSIDGSLVAIDYKGNFVPFVPEHTFSASADWHFPLSVKGKSEIVVGANLNGQGRTYWDEANSRSQKAYAVLGAHVGFNISRCQFNLWATNITDTRYNTFAVSSQATGENIWVAQRAAPFRIGLDWKISL